MSLPSRAASLASKPSSTTSWLSIPGNPLLPWPTTTTTTSSPSPSPPPPSDDQEPETDLYTKISNLLKSRHPPPFSSAWSLLLSSPTPPPFSAFLPLIRRYARHRRPSAALRTLHYFHHLHPSTAQLSPDPFDSLIDALVKENLVSAAQSFVDRRLASDPSWAPSIHSHNILLHGLFRSRNLAKAERLWLRIRRSPNLTPTVVTFGTAIEGLCRMRRPDHALHLLDEMIRVDKLEPNHFTLNPIVDSLAEAARFREALALVEKFPLYNLSPNIYTYNSLVKGFVKNGDLVGASKMLKAMIGREILPTARTYNYFFGYFAKFGKIEEAMSLYEKMVSSGYAPDRLTYQLLVKLLCEKERLDLAVQMIGEMNRSGFESDLATCTMHVHLLVRLRRLEEACGEFERMVEERGIVPQYVTYRMLVKELKRLPGTGERVRRVSELMDSVPHSTKLPGSYREREGDEAVALRREIVQKARVISETLKAFKDRPKEMDKLKESAESPVEHASRLIADIKRRIYAVKAE